MLQLLTALISGLLFSIGLIVSGMSNPAKVLNFLDVTGNWDATLAFVMSGALLVTVPGFYCVLKRSAPLLCGEFHLPTKSQIDAPLLMGATIFGIGWGLAGLCPGPAIASLATGACAVAFVAAMILGLLAAKYFIEPHLRRRSVSSRHVVGEKQQ
jgi:uncharacterized membrane protein YedE/YeeE